MKLESRVEDDIVILEPKGDLTDSSLLVPSREIIQQFLEKGYKKFIFDVKDVRHTNSTGMGIIVASLTAVKTKGGEFVFANVHEAIQSLLTITRLTEISSTFRNLEDAKIYFSKKT